MLNREKITETLSYDLQFMDDRWDRALLGYAESGGPGRYVLPCYGYQAMKAILRDIGYYGEDAYVALQVMMRNMPKEAPLILTKLNRKDLWKTASDSGFMRWESLDNAVLGVGKIKYKTTGLIYSRPLCIDILSTTSAAVDRNTKLLNAINKLEEELIPVEAPRYTPWYLTPIK
jgi:hypothetical protein